MEKFCIRMIGKLLPKAKSKDEGEDQEDDEMLDLENYMPFAKTVNKMMGINEMAEEDLGKLWRDTVKWVNK